MLDDDRPRPTGLTIIALLNAIQGLWLLAVGSMFAGLGFIGLFTIDPSAVGGYSVLYGVVIAAVGVVHLAIAYALYAYRRWAWLGAIVVSVADLIVSAGAFAFSGKEPTLVSLVIPVVVIVYLLRPSIRAPFAS